MSYPEELEERAEERQDAAAGAGGSGGGAGLGLARFRPRRLRSGECERVGRAAVEKARSSCSSGRRAPGRRGPRCRAEVGVVGGAREGQHDDGAWLA
jgi:hypothetical protein